MKQHVLMDYVCMDYVWLCDSGFTGVVDSGLLTIVHILWFTFSFELLI